MNDYSLIAGKDPIGPLCRRDVVNGILVALPVFLGVYGAQAIESSLWAAIAACAGLGISLLLMRVLGGRRMAEVQRDVPKTMAKVDEDADSPRS